MEKLEKIDLPFEPCEDWSSCVCRNEHPELTYSEWVEIFCGSCPDARFKNDNFKEV